MEKGSGGGEIPVRIEGHDHRGQAVVRTPRGVEHVPFRTLSPQRGVAPQLMRKESEVLLQGIQPNQVHSASPVIRSALNIALQQRRIVGPHTAQEYVNALRADGHSVALVGGAIRDVVQALRDNPNATAQQLSRLFADLDIVTTAAPSEVRRIAQRVAPEARGGGIWSSTAIERFGIVGIGARKDGLDVASLRSGPPGQTTFTLGKRLGDDAASRDFTFNQLYYLYDHGVIVDPAGSGIRDAEQKQLRVNTQSPFSAETLSMRFFKFRIKGYSTDRQTRDFMRRHIEGTWPRLSAGIPTSFLRCIPADCHDTRALRQFIRKFEQAMANDGMQDLFDRFIRPNERAILSTFASRQGR